MARRARLPSVPRRTYDEVRPEIRSGDILMCSGSAVFSRLIQSATRSPWSHVGFIVYAERVDRMILMESVESIGVRAVGLRSYTRDYNGSGSGYPGRLFIARHDDVFLDPEEALMAFFRNAFDLLGYPYDRDEIIKIAARVAGSKFGMEYAPGQQNSDRSYICSEYAAACFAKIGVEIPYDRRGFISPADFAACPHIAVLWEIGVDG